MRSTPTRLAVEVLGCTSNLAGAGGFPHSSAPGAGVRWMIHGTRLSAAQVHSRRGSLTFALNSPPEAAMVEDSGVTSKSQFLGRRPPQRPIVMGVVPADPTTVLTAPSRSPQVLAGGAVAPHLMLDEVSGPEKVRVAAHPLFEHRSSPWKSPLEGSPTSWPATVPVRPSAAS